MTRSAYTIIPKHNYEGRTVGFEVRRADAPRDTAGDELAYVRTLSEARRIVEALRQDERDFIAHALQS